MDFQPTTVDGLYVIQQNTFFDERGAFIKTYQNSRFEEIHFNGKFRESYFTESKAGVIRGMHFQSPPADHAKLATVITGRIIDVVLDIRKASPSYGTVFSVELSRENARSILIPPGCAHGFCALSDHSIVYYDVTSEYSREHDHGIHPLSFDFDWPINSPVISERDLAFPRWNEFKSPFLRANTNI